DRAVDVGLAGCGNRGEGDAVGRADDVEARTRKRIHRLAADDLHESASFGHRPRQMRSHFPKLSSGFRRRGVYVLTREMPGGIPPRNPCWPPLSSFGVRHLGAGKFKSIRI